MATNKRSGTRKGSGGQSGGNDRSGMIAAARSRPVATAAAVGGAVAAGVFLWSRRNQISDQIGSLAQRPDQSSEATQPESDVENGSMGDSFATSPDSEAAGGGKTQAEIAQEALTLKEIGSAA